MYANHVIEGLLKMSGFVRGGLESEVLDELEELYSLREQIAYFIYGDKGAGKTTLLEKFCEGKDALFFRFKKCSEEENVAYMEDLLREDSDCPHLNNLSDAIIMIRKRCIERRLVVVFDDFQNLLGRRGTESLFQRFLDRDIRDTETVVIFSGRLELLDVFESYRGPFYGRLDSACGLSPRRCEDCTGYHPGMSDKDMISTYLTVGGLPANQAMMNSETYSGCLQRCFLNEDAPLLNESDEILGGFKPFQKYSGVLACIANGKTDPKAIAKELRISQTLCMKYLETLEYVGFVERPDPMLMDGPCSSPYSISHPLLDFNYRVLRRCEHPEKANVEDIMDKVDAFLEKRFEALCRDYLCRNYPVKKVGKWWGRIDWKYAEIGTVAEVIDDQSSKIFVCKCKFSDGPLGFKEYESLKKRVDVIEGLDDVLMVFFSGSGFDERFREFAESGGIMLVGLDKLLGRVPAGPIPVPESLRSEEIIQALHLGLGLRRRGGILADLPCA